MIDRRQLLRSALLSVGALSLPLRRPALGEDNGPRVSTRAIDLVLEARVVDMLGLVTLDWQRLYRWQRDPEEFSVNDYRHLEASGVQILHPAVETAAADPRQAALQWITGWRRLIGRGSCFLSPVTSVSDLLWATRFGQIGIILGFQNSSHFDTPADVGDFYRLGQRVSQLTYNANNRLGGGCYAGKDPGLSGFGHQVVAEMNRLGMAIDVSHCGERTSIDAMAASEKPVLVTHSNCAALRRHPRCKSDRVLRRLAASGGVMGITVVRTFVSRRSPSLDDLLDHFDHVARLVGIEHVGLGSDIDVDALDPAKGTLDRRYAIRGLVPRYRIFQIADGLLRRGYSPRDVELVLGGNFLRALSEIWGGGSWQTRSGRETRRDPFCPAPHRKAPKGLVVE